MTEKRGIESDWELPAEVQSDAAPRRIYRTIMQDLEEHRIVPGQRLVETDLATRFGVGRNAVREAMQQLAARGVVDLSRHRSAAIREFDLDETLEVLDVAAVMTGLLARTAALKYGPQHSKMLRAAMAAFPKIGTAPEPGVFSRARRQFYRTLLIVGGNRELQRLYPAIGMHIIYSQFRSPKLQDLRVVDYRGICSAVASGKADAAERAGVEHVERVREIILGLAGRA